METSKKILMFLLLGIFTLKARGQEVNPDQNPNYQKSMNRYLQKKDSLISGEGTTVQNTYKAYDWMELKKERRELRRERRYNIRMERALAPRYYTHPYYNEPYYYNNHTRYNYPYSYNDYYGNANCCRPSPYIDFGFRRFGLYNRCR